MGNPVKGCLGNETGFGGTATSATSSPVSFVFSNIDFAPRSGGPGVAFELRIQLRHRRVHSSIAVGHAFGEYTDMRRAFILSCYDRVEELLAHLDILQFCPVQHEVIVVYSGDRSLPVPFTRYSAQANLRSGAGFALLAGLEEAVMRGIDAICYRNGDDWLFRQELVAARFGLMENYDVAGYSWFYGNATDELALNELYVKMSPFRGVDFGAWRRRVSDARLNPEYLAAEMLRVPTRFCRLDGRELPEGIGRALDGGPPENNRWFNLNWQLITAHDSRQRWYYYQRLRPFIPYADALEAMPHFGAWVRRNRQP